MHALDRSLAEDELAVRDGDLLIPRVVPDEALNRKAARGAKRQPKLEPPKQDRKLALMIGKVGLLEALHFGDDQDAETSELGDDDVEINVKASALNFRDLTASMGIIDDHRLGDECAGIIARTGRNVKKSQLTVGERVVAWRPGQGAHRSIVRNHAAYTQAIGDMDYAVAAAFPCIATTAYYSLYDLARLQAGEICLIHAAAGGVGQMAIQLAQMAGAHVIATVGSGEKREFLKTQFGLDDRHILSSRDASFFDGVMEVTNGRGCDVALNSLSGELLRTTWRCVAPFGRLVEIGKRDIQENMRLEMDLFRRNVSYSSVDLITIHDLNKPLGARLLRESFKLLRDGQIAVPSPLKLFSYAEAQDAFRLLQKGRFFGKVVLVPGDEDLVPVMPRSYGFKALFDPKKTYLLVGGLGGIGRALSEWVIQRGARDLAFMSRSGASRADARALVDWLTARQIRVRVFQTDVADQDAVEECVRSISGSLGGVFHAAMVLRDAPLSEMTIDQWNACVGPKIQGALNLHRATAPLPLDFFICFSSSSGRIGAIGQANYSAANSYLDALMRFRHENGVAGFTINVGVVKEVGHLVTNRNLEEIIERIGYESITEHELFCQIEEAVTAKAVPWKSRSVDGHQLIAGINIFKEGMYWSARSMFRHLCSANNLKSTVKSSNAQDLSISLGKAPDKEARSAVMMPAFVKKIAFVLAIPVSNISPASPLSTYGLDSLVALELRKWFSNAVGVELTLFDILKTESIQALVHKVSSMIETTSSTERETVSSLPIQPSKPLAGSNVGSVEDDTPDEFSTIQVSDKVPLSSFQARMWYFHSLLPDKSALNVQVTCSIHGKPQLALLQRALDELALRNDILRTSYLEEKESTQQAVMPACATQIQYQDVSSCSDPEEALNEHSRMVRGKAFDLGQGEIMNISLVQLAEARYALVFICHHIALDNGSTKSFLSTKLCATSEARADWTQINSPNSMTPWQMSRVWHPFWHPRSATQALQSGTTV